MAAPTETELRRDSMGKHENKCEELKNKTGTSNNVIRVAEKLDKIRRFLSDSITHRQIDNRSSTISISDSCEEEEAFLQRLSTYTSIVWSVKPRSVVPPVCASLGWIVVRKDLLECVSCKQFLFTELPPVWKQSAYDQAVSQLIVSLNKKHHQYCPWPLNASKQNYLCERFLDIDSTIKAFVERLSELNRLTADDLPNIATDLPKQLMSCDYLQETAALLLKTERAKLLKVATILAICGWRTKLTELDRVKLFCVSCFRQTEPYLYATRVNEKVSDVLAESLDGDLKRRRKLVVRKFHPLSEHQSWCPWVDTNYRTADGSPVKEGWKSLVEVLSSQSVQQETAISQNKMKTTNSLRNGVLTTRRIVRKWVTDVSLEDILESP